jgi:rare lipoprotein A
VGTPPTTAGVETQEGMASWYGEGDGYHGAKTASGERFDKNELTAAHFDLPFGTTVRVTNRKNGRQVVVRINDRFPVETLRKGRIIDLSYRAAQVLDMVPDGVVPVTLQIVSDEQ